MLNLKAHAAIATLFLAGAAGAATTNGIANGGFEVVNGNQPVGWVGADSSAPVLSNDAHSGAHAMLLSVPGGFGGSGLLQDSIAHGGLAALTVANVGDTPVLSFWAKGDVSPTGNAKFGLSYLGDNGVLYDSGLQYFHSDLSGTTWKQISFQAAAIPTGAKAVYLLLNTAVGPLQDGRVNAVYIDDVQLTLTTAPVPEPETYALLIAGLGVVAAVARRRRA
ncbi:PEP-CTERM sorting domain-containing protein [Roseateles sp. LKC17W]|uniref:PEP-CTERM sorting domain-containing protein n=1 Tax=Pelomonas margarita TaxID=3299031 RepID=A0ABW7FCY9_9BURK